MKTLVAKVHGTEIDRKRVAEASLAQKHQFKFEATRGVAKQFRNDVKIEVKGGLINE